jgi:predicted transcriptional regulator
MGGRKRDIVVNARLDAETVNQLDELAGEMQRTRSFLIAQAVRSFVEREYAFLCAVLEGEADVRSGRTLPHEEVLKWMEDLKGADG